MRRPLSVLLLALACLLPLAVGVQPSHADTFTAGVVRYFAPSPQIKSVAAANKKLKHTPKSFRKAIGRAGKARVRAFDSCASSQYGTWVSSYHPKRYALAWETDCDTGVWQVWRRATVKGKKKWVVVGGRKGAWSVSHQAWKCGVLRKAKVPWSVLAFYRSRTQPPTYLNNCTDGSKYNDYGDGPLD